MNVSDSIEFQEQLFEDLQDLVDFVHENISKIVSLTDIPMITSLADRLSSACEWTSQRPRTSNTSPEFMAMIHTQDDYIQKNMAMMRGYLFLIRQRINAHFLRTELLDVYQALVNRTLGPTTSPRKRESVPDDWVSVCSNKQDFISQTDWDATLDKDDAIVLKFVDKTTKVGFCYKSSDIEQLIRSATSAIAVTWIPNPQLDQQIIAQDQRNNGIGMMPSVTSPFYLKLWPYNHYIDLDSLFQVIKSSKRTFFFEPSGQPNRVGNISGTYGMSEQHGQLPAVMIWRLGAKNKALM